MQTRTEYLSQLSQLDHMVKDMGDLVSSSLSQALQASGTVIKPLPATLLPKMTPSTTRNAISSTFA